MVGDESWLRYDATGEPEFDAGRWVDYWSPVREVIYFKRAVYARALQELGERAFAEGPPPRPEWWSDELVKEQSQARRRQQPGWAAAVELEMPVAASAENEHTIDDTAVLSDAESLVIDRRTK